MVYGPTAYISIEVELCTSETTYLNLQEVITPDTLVVHLVVSVIRVATALILNECEPTIRVNEISNERNWN